MVSCAASNWFTIGAVMKADLKLVKASAAEFDQEKMASLLVSAANGATTPKNPVIERL